MNTYVKTFESFITEGKNWMNFDAAQMASRFTNDYDRNDATGEDLMGWLEMIAQGEKIEHMPDSSWVKELVDILKSKGYKDMSIDDVNN